MKTIMRKKLFIALSIIGLVLGFTISANATVLMFDELRFEGDEMGLPNSYMGLTWNEWRVCDTNIEHFGHAVSGDNTVYHASPASITGPNFNFYGTYLSGAYKDGMSIDVVGIRDGNQVYSSTVLTRAQTLIWFDFNFLNIDELLISCYGGTPVEPYLENSDVFHMDNFTYSAVPEPSTFVLLAIGIAGILGRKIIGRKSPA